MTIPRARHSCGKRAFWARCPFQRRSPCPVTKCRDRRRARMADTATSPFTSSNQDAKEMDEIWTRFAENMMGRVSGPMKFRLLLQPTMAAIFAIRAGLADAKDGKPPYFWALVNDPAHRAEMLKDGWKMRRQDFPPRNGSRRRLPGHRRAVRVCGRSDRRGVGPGQRAMQFGYLLRCDGIFGFHASRIEASQATSSLDTVI